MIFNQLNFFLKHILNVINVTLDKKQDYEETADYVNRHIYLGKLSECVEEELKKVDVFSDKGTFDIFAFRLPTKPVVYRIYSFSRICDFLNVRLKDLQ